MAIYEGVICLQEDYMGVQSEQINYNFIEDLLVLRIHCDLTFAERQLGKSDSPEKGRNLIRQTRMQLPELAPPLLESMVQEITRVRVLRIHDDIRNLSGDEVVVFHWSKRPALVMRL